MKKKRRRKFEQSVTYSGEKVVDFAKPKTLYIHLEQINSSNNYFNGAQSTLLCCIPIKNDEFGDIVSVRFEHLEIKN